MARSTLGSSAAPKVMGIVFLAMVVGGVYLTFAIFTKKFTDYDEVTLQTSTIGLQLPDRADVKIRGVIVGEVLGFEANGAGDGANVTLGIFPSELDTIPADVTGSIVPKTLFGEKYVSLVVPDKPDSDHIEAGATIKRTVVSTEVEQVLSDLYPLLRTVQPAALNQTLNALSTALDGRGDQLGQNIETLDGYLKKINPQIPALIEDLRLTSQVSDNYAEVMPQIAQILDDTVLTTGTLEGREQKLHALFQDVSAFSDTATDFLDENGDNLIRLSEVGQEQLRVFAKYAPEYNCLTRGIVNAGKLQAEAFRGFTLHIVLETLPHQPRPYDANDTPHFGEDRGPSCLHLPNPPWNQSNPVRHQPNFDDGVDEPTGKGTSRVAPNANFRTSVPGSPEETALLRSLLAPALGVTSADVPDLGVLLVGPMARGAEVSLR
ncbi:virulence factor Mce [Nocardioides sp. Root1257]|uniref:MCE family protein n=1 Tax=unclassified Nocardioides TaxID=2615069 RepID=UPI0006FCD7CC|nr:MULTISPECIES: MCE family protein [unclassified Nocardioides]KQW47150.1 virulence factor Mce [Nocardioides sp. Root1257]KRC43897.1 virulence factor Mce [Nocardioides sp. Root224]